MPLLGGLPGKFTREGREARSMLDGLAHVACKGFLRNFKRSWNAICVKIGGRTDFSFRCDFQEENVHKALNKTGDGVVQKTLSQLL